MPRLLQLITDIIQIRDDYVSKDISVYAAQATFFILLSLFPFLMFLLTLLQYLPGLDQDTLIRVLKLLTPETLHGFISAVVGELSIEAPGAIASFAALSALWSAGKGIMSIVRGLNRIWDYADCRSYLARRIVCAAYTFVFAVSCAAALMLLVLGSSIHRLAVSRLPFLEHITDLVIRMGGFLACPLLFAAFLILYTFLPDKKQNPWQQMPGAVFAAAGWISSSCLFSVYFRYFHNFSRIYGSLAAAVLMMLWLYAGICILFLGAELNRCLCARLQSRNI